MLFKRHPQRYSRTPAPVTPYQKAAQVWDERIGSARLQARNWRLAALGSLLVSLALTAGLLWQMRRSHITPYVVEVAAQGAVRAIGPAASAYQPSDVQIAFHLARFIRNVRGLSIDPIMVRQAWLEAYDYVTERGARQLNAHVAQVDPFKALIERSVSVEVTSVVKASADSFQVKWREEHWRLGNRTRAERWTAILTVTLQAPRTEEALRKNPLGIYVHGLDWSRELEEETAK